MHKKKHEKSGDKSTARLKPHSKQDVETPTMKTLPDSSSTIESGGHSVKTLLLALSLALIAAIIYLKMPVTQVTDSRFGLLLSHSIAYEHSTRLDTYLYPPDYAPKESFFYWFWQLSPKRDGKVVFGHDGAWDGRDELYYRYPYLPYVLSIPFVVVAHQMGLNIVENGRFNFMVENTVHRLIATIIGGATVALIFLMARLVLPLRWAVVIGVMGGFGTQVVSTLTRGVWSDTWAVFITLLALHHLIAHAAGRAKLQPIWLALLAGAAFFCKPVYAVLAMATVAYVGLLAFQNRQGAAYAMLIRLLAVGAALAIGFIAYSFYQFGTWVPAYFIPDIQTKYIPEALMGHLFSPSRGLLIFSPFLIWVIFILVTHLKHLPFKTLCQASLVPVAVIGFVSCAWGVWWGGLSYGPRLIIPLLPWTILYSIVAVCAFHQRLHIEAKPKIARQGLTPFKNVQKSAHWATIIVFCVISLFMHSWGAIEEKTWLDWFYRPSPVFNAPNARVWSWDDPIFLAGLKKRPHER